MAADTGVSALSALLSVAFRKSRNEWIWIWMNMDFFPPEIYSVLKLINANKPFYVLAGIPNHFVSSLISTQSCVLCYKDSSSKILFLFLLDFYLSVLVSVHYYAYYSILSS